MAVEWAVADVEAGDIVADADELELATFWEDVEDEEVGVIEEMEVVIKDVETVHWPF